MAILYLSPIQMGGGSEIRDLHIETLGGLPTADASQASRLVYHGSQLKYCDGTQWITLGSAGAGGPPSGTAGGDLSGSYPNPVIAAGVIVDADVNASAAIQQSKISGLTTSLSGKVDNTINVTAGAGLVGGGTLAANRTFDVGAGWGILVSADLVTVDSGIVAAKTDITTAITSHKNDADPHVFYQLEAERGAPDGYCALDSNQLIPTYNLPPLAINDVFVVASEAAMLALTAQVGDMAIRTDVNKTFVLSATPAATLANWKEMMATGQVVSVNGQTGVVLITTASLGAVPTTRSVIAGNGLTGGGDLSADRTLNIVGDTTISASADFITVLSAPKWTTPRSITLTGDVTGTVASVDGSANISIATTAVGAGTAAKHYAANVGLGPTVIINHALNTRDVTVGVYRNSAPWDTVYCDVERTDVNNVTLKFTTAIAANTYRVVVQGK